LAHFGKLGPNLILESVVILYFQIKLYQKLTIVTRQATFWLAKN